MRHTESSAGRTLKLRRKHLAHARAYAETHLRQALNLGSANINVDVARGGRNSLVYFLAVDAAPRAVIYLIPDRTAWRDMKDSLELGAGHNLPIPRLLHARRRGMLGFGPKFWELATDFAAGSPVHKISWSPERIRILAHTIARLHAVESSAWGKQRRLRSSPMLEALKANIDRRLEKIRAFDGGRVASFADDLEAFFRDQVSGLGEPATFQLCHHHLFGDDMILSPDESTLTLLDCASLQFSRAARDLAAIREGFFAGKEDAWRDFLDAYFKDFPTSTRTEWERELPLYRALYLTIKYHRHLGRRAESYFRERLETVCGMSGRPTELPNREVEIAATDP